MKLTVDKEICLKPLEEGEANTLFQLVDENREHLREFLPWVDSTTSPADSLAFIKSVKDKVCLGIYVSNALVGTIGLNDIDWCYRVATVGYWLAKNNQGRGIMVRSVRTLIDYAFHELKLHRIEIRCAVHNIKSQKIPETLGFTKEGTLKGALSLYGAPFDAFMYGLVKTSDAL